MAISQQAAQQIAALLSQSAGLPGGVAAEVAQRLLSRASNGRSEARTYGPDDAISQTIKNNFSPREQGRPKTQSGEDGKDGLAGTGATGLTGQAGNAGAGGRDGEVDYDSIRKYIDDLFSQMDGGGGDSGGGGDGGVPNWLRQSLADILERLRRLENRRSDTWCTWAGNDACSVLRQHRNTLEQLKRAIEKANQKIRDLGKRLEAIEDFMPPRECP